MKSCRPTPSVSGQEVSKYSLRHMVVTLELRACSSREGVSGLRFRSASTSKGVVFEVGGVCEHGGVAGIDLAATNRWALSTLN